MKSQRQGAGCGSCPSAGCRRGRLRLQIGLPSAVVVLTRLPVSIIFSNVHYSGIGRPEVRWHVGSGRKRRAQSFILPDDPGFHRDTRSTMPSNFSSAPIGICMTTGLAPSAVELACRRSARNQRRSRSILLTKQRCAARCICRPDATRFRTAARRRHSRNPKPQTAPSRTAQRTLDFDGEIHVPGGVDDVDAMLLGYCATPFGAFPKRGRGRRGDGDAALLLLLHPVHRRVAVVNLADLVGLAGVDTRIAFGGRGLAGINVGHDADVAVPFERGLSCHCAFSFD